MQTRIMPDATSLYKACLESIKSRGGRATNLEILNDVADLLKLDNEILSIIHSGNRTEIEYRLAWARTRAKKKGEIFSPGKGVWELSK